MLKELIRLFFPQTCIACNGSMVTNEQFLCSGCLLHLPQTRFHQMPQNPLEKMFWGRLPIIRGFAFLQFRKGNSVQRILHEIKYRNNRELAVFIGKYYGSILRAAGIFPDAIAAIPLHKDKQRKRGYNQSALIAQGIAESLGIEDLSDHLQRLKATETQTKKSRFERWENVGQVFAVTDNTPFMNRHVLLVDDVITTGATIEACGHALLSVSGTTISVAGIAFAA
jgi:ComF family protein